MAQIINTNVQSINAQRQLNRSSSSMSTAMERLSSGLRINSAKDDAAGLAISDRMTSQIKGLNQAVRNANDGISLAQVSEGALQETSSILQRMRELSVQSANDSNSASDRANLQKEVIQLQAEINRIADTTTFNGKSLLDGTFTSQKFQVGANANQTINVTIGNARADSIGTEGVSSNGSGTIAVTAATSAGASKVLTTENLTISGSLGTAVADVATGDTAKQVADKVNNVTDQTGVQVDATTKVKIGTVTQAGTNTFELSGSNSTAVSISATVASASDLTNMVTAINDRQAETGITAELSADKASLTLTSAAGDDIVISNATSAAAASGGNVMSVQGVTAAGTATAAAVLVKNGADSTRVTGYLEFDSADIYSVTSGASGGLFNGTGANASTLSSVSNVDISTQSGSNDALQAIDGALQAITNSRANLGAVQNRFSSTIANLENVSQNVSAARSRIQDADFAQESASLAKSQILQQAGISMLSQANSSSQSVLSLLQ